MEITFNLPVDNKGTIDRDASMKSFETMLTNLCAEQEKEQEAIANAVSAVFDALKGKRAIMDYVISQAINKIGNIPENYVALQNKVRDYLQQNAKGENALFNIGKGKTHGGIGRVKDMAT